MTLRYFAGVRIWEYLFLERNVTSEYALAEVLTMQIHKVIGRMLVMGSKPWLALIWSLRGACLLLLAAFVFLLRYQESESLSYLRLSGSMQDFAQLFLLAGVFLPVCLEDMLPPDQRDRQDPSHR